MVRNFVFFKKFRHKYIWKRLFYERLTEPIHLNIVSLFVMVFGGLRRKIEFDMVVRHHNAYGILKCADYAKKLGLKSVKILEFGVANGAGLLNMVNIAKKVTALTGIKFEIFGFDTGKGMPPPDDYRDHPDIYSENDFTMNVDALTKLLPPNTKLFLGDIKETLPEFIKRISAKSPVGYVVVDVDYYKSTKDVLLLFEDKPEKYLPKTILYLDDLEDESHNSYCGELAAVNEFNAKNKMRKIERHTFFRSYRVFKNARWIDHIYCLHILDHHNRSYIGKRNKKKHILGNPYF